MNSEAIKHFGYGIMGRLKFYTVRLREPAMSTRCLISVSCTKEAWACRLIYNLPLNGIENQPSSDTRKPSLHLRHY